MDLLIAVLSTDRRHGVAYRRIVDALTTAGRTDEALQWALRGLADTSGRIDESLVDFVAARHAEAGHVKDVYTLRREHFQRSRSLAAYQSLREAATAAEDWPATRQWALDLLRPTGDAARRPFPVWHGNVLVDVLLWESATEEA